jgi:hypothetical protein
MRNNQSSVASNENSLVRIKRKQVKQPAAWSTGSERQIIRSNEEMLIKAEHLSRRKDNEQTIVTWHRGTKGTIATFDPLLSPTIMKVERSLCLRRSRHWAYILKRGKGLEIIKPCEWQAGEMRWDIGRLLLTPNRRYPQEQFDVKHLMGCDRNFRMSALSSVLDGYCLFSI